MSNTVIQNLSKQAIPSSKLARPDMFDNFEKICKLVKWDSMGLDHGLRPVNALESQDRVFGDYASQ